ncbi:hypothetical protein MKEN_00894000 [Mycena kentingensis (nom. inval.)]|nr:hypothetical protein MKEN_00894000 [Mycena kentingensis (nom. inval.)]
MTVSLQSTFGSAFVGLVVSGVLYGVTILQTYLYYRTFPEDSKLLKWMVAILWLLDTSHLVLCTISVYTVLVLNFENPEILTTTTWSMNVQTDFNGLIGLIVECFYARRVWIVSRNAYLTGVILVLSVIHFDAGSFGHRLVGISAVRWVLTLWVVFTIGSFEMDRMEFSNLVALKWVTSAGLGSAAAADMLIGISLCWYLRQNRTGITRTDSLISTLMKYSLTTGFLTGIIACCVVITFGIMPGNFVYVAFF